MLKLVIRVSKYSSEYIQEADLLEEDNISSIAFHVLFDLVSGFFAASMRSCFGRVNHKRSV